MDTLPEQFKGALTRVELGAKRDRAIEAHKDVREVLEADGTLKGWGVDTILIGSYGRATAIYPGRDVDVFVKLPGCDKGPEDTYQAVRKPLRAKYGTRVTEGRRSLKISFPDDFSVDAVAATPSGAHWRIPQNDAAGNRTEWEETDPEKLGELTTARNKEPTVNGQGAYVPVVKLVRQVRSHHLADAKPGGLYFEFETYWAFGAGVMGTSFAELLASTLDRIATQLESRVVINDPALGRQYSPPPKAEDIAAAAKVFRTQATAAKAALAAERCPAAAAWRQILGRNERGWVFPLPEGCDESGKAVAGIAAVADSGSREARPFA